MNFFNKFYTNGVWKKSNSNSFFSFKRLNNKKIIIVNSKEDDLQNIIKFSEKGSKTWENTNYKERSLILKKFSKLIKKNKEELALSEKKDTGKSIEQCRSEIDHCIKLWLHASSVIKKIKKKKLIISKKTYCEISYEPVGITAVITPWNFPLIVLSERLPYILAAGCVAIIKPSEFASESICKLVSLAKKAGFPNGVINLLLGSGDITGSKLINHKSVKMISFTGSSFNGKNIMKSASGDLKRISLELGGKNPFIILDKLNLKNAVKNLIISFTHNAGQSCVGVSKVYIEKKNLKTLLEEIKSQLENQPKFTKQISNFKQYNKIYNFFKKNKFKKNNIVYGKLPQKINKQNIFFPIIFKNLRKDHPLNNFEIFGPVLTIETFKDIEKLKNELNSSNYGLSCLIWAKKINLALDFTKNLKIGRVWINGNITQNYPEIPIGGFKWSGIGRETGIEGIFNYSEIRSVIINKI